MCADEVASAALNMVLAANGADEPAFLGQGPYLERLTALVERAAQFRECVLIVGETGTGKELVARWIHRRSPRADGPFVVVNSAAVPSSLWEAEFFGHERGAFTDAHRLRIGRVEAAANGSLFLDEVADLPQEAQAKILRVIENREVSRLGKSADFKVDVRFIAASNIDLSKKVRAGEFRQDLYYRLNGLTIRIPPLRERRDDIDLITASVLKQINSLHPQRPLILSDCAATALRAHPWPGNVRELRAVLYQAAIEGFQAPVTAADLTPLLDASEIGSASPQPLPDGVTLKAGLARLVASHERAWIESALQRAGGSYGVAAKSLGLSVRTLYNKRRQFWGSRQDSSA